MSAITVPRFALGLALAFWGWQTNHLIVGVGLGLVLEGLRWWRLRLDLGAAEHATVADLSTIGFVLLAVILAANRGIGRGILESFVWLPVALSPIISAQLVTAERRVPLSALFRYVRKMKREKPDTKDPPVDVSAVYFGLALLSAGVANQRGPGYYLGVVLGAACLLYVARPRHASLAAGAALLAAAAGLGHVAHVGLSETQQWLVDWVMELNLIRTADPDPYRVRTEIGSLGQLKKYDAIVLRVYADEKDAARVRLLHRASYNTYVGTSWVARNTKMDPFNSEADNETWIFSPVAPTWKVKLATRFDLGRTLLALPPGTVRINAFQANAMQRNVFGAVHATLPVDWAPYEAAINPDFPAYAEPGEDDLSVPPAERAVLEGVVAELGLRGMAPAEAARRIEAHLGTFRYSTYRTRPVPRDATAMGDFLTRTRSGHCEYFAAATALLLRAAGIPARYATGFAVMEYSGLERAYVVRTRHAHAWTRAWLGGRWVDVDTTPSAWFGEEEAEAPVWQGLADLLRYAGFRWSQRGDFEAGDGWYAVLALLAVGLAWSVLRNRRVVREKQETVAARVRYPGEDSEFYALEKSLPPRDPGEPQAAWLTRIAKSVTVERLASLRAALHLHQRYRFDPLGLAAAERENLRELCRSLATPIR